MDIVIAGGGVAGLEALLALHGALRDGARFTLIAPDPDFSYRPLAVAEPFGLGHAHRVPLTRFAEETGAELVIDRVVAVDDEGGQARLAGGGTRAFDALLLAPGGRAVAGVEGATTGGRAATPRATVVCSATSRTATRSGSRSSCRPGPSGRCPPTNSP